MSCGPELPQLPAHWPRVEPAGDGLLAVDAAGVIVDWDANAEAIFGWSSDEAVGRTLAGAIAAPATVHDALTSLARADPQLAGPLARRRLLLAARHRDGRLLPVELTAWATPGAPTVTALARDLTDSLKAQTAMAQLAAIVASTGDAVVSENLDGTITSWNGGAEQIFGWAAAEVVGKPAALLVPGDLVEETAAVIERVRGGDAVSSYETRRLPKHGEAIDVALTLSPIRDEEGHVTGIATIARDITEQRWLAAALDASNRQLQAALEAAEEAEQRVRSFLADAAHQLRQPITGVRACVESLLGDPSQPDRQRLLANMVRETARAGRLIASLLRMARLDQGEPVSPAPCDIVGVCTDEADRLYSLAPHLDIVLRAERLDDPHPAVDAEAVREVVANLLDNARRYAVERITVTVRVAQDTVEIRVADDGPGLPDDLAERVFERFVTIGEHGGSGLGLPIARGLARAHGGDLVYCDGAFVLRVRARSDDAVRVAGS
ncbi:MAG TPA: PAS domain S-box protein [Egibacteraceae bacterium]|jgi:PAS domain S-box-containing protein|nr:PAS domain S-box protein [Egibacteraceae bacterium]